MDDQRNLLFHSYCEILDALRPDGFVFENVTGLLNMRGGEVFAQVKEAFAAVMPRVEGWVLSADHYGVPQRRKRVFLVGATAPTIALNPPPPITAEDDQPPVTVEEAIGDLPPLTTNQDGVASAYATAPRTMYQALMRGLLTPHEYVEHLRARRRCRSLPI